MNALLVVEDLPDIRAWLVDTARIAFPDSEVVAVGRCREGLGEAVARRFDVALIDLELPDGSGVAVIQALRTHQPQAMSVVLTIHDDDDHLFPALQAGAFGYLLKESPQEDLVAQLRRIAQGEPPLSPPIARRVLTYFSAGVQAIKAGAEDFFTKPVEREEFIRAIDHAIARHRLANERDNWVRRATAQLQRLTRREREVFDLVVRGRMNKQVAFALGTTERTVKAHRHKVMEKMQVRSVVELVSCAERLGLSSGSL